MGFYVKLRKKNFFLKKSPRIELNEAVQILKLRNKLGSDYVRRYEKAFNDFEAQKRRHTAPSASSASSAAARGGGGEGEKGGEERTTGREQVGETPQSHHQSPPTPREKDISTATIGQSR